MQEIVVCLIPENPTFKPAAADVAQLLRVLVRADYADNDEVYLDIGFENGHHLPGASTMITMEHAAEELEKQDDATLAGFSVENIRGTSKIPNQFENCDQRNLSLMGWLAVRVFEEPYPIFDLEKDYWIACDQCGHQGGQAEWTADGSLRRCPQCGHGSDLIRLDFHPPVDFARFIFEVSELVFNESPPLLLPGSSLKGEAEGALGCDLKMVWYRM